MRSKYFIPVFLIGYFRKQCIWITNQKKLIFCIILIILHHISMPKCNVCIYRHWAMKTSLIPECVYNSKPLFELNMLKCQWQHKRFSLPPVVALFMLMGEVLVIICLNKKKYRVMKLHIYQMIHTLSILFFYQCSSMFDYTTSANLPQLILNQFKWLDRVINSKVGVLNQVKMT